jgi:tetratricopeptide (TPR) repeat protein
MLPSSKPATPVIQFMLDQALEHHRAGRLAMAEQTYHRILAIQPDHADCLHLQGMVAYQSGDSLRAATMIRKAISLNPRAASYHSNLGNILFHQGRARDAAACYLRALEINPDLAEVHVNLGNVFLAANLWTDAETCYLKALSITPDIAEAYHNLGNILRFRAELEESAICYRRALMLKPDYTEAHHDLGRVLRAMGDLAGALHHFRQAQMLEPDHPKAVFAEAMVLLLQGEFEAGWARYERRWSSTDHATPMRNYVQPLWNGEPLTSGKLFLWPEQGVGDEMMFAGIVNDAVRAGIACVLECDDRLQPLFRRSFSEIEILSSDDTVDVTSGIAAHLPVGSLPFLFRKTLASFATHTCAYLKPDQVKTQELRNRYFDDRPLIGLAWYTENLKTGADRSIHLSLLAPLFEHGEFRGISLQYGEMESLTGQVAAAGIQLFVDPSVDQLIDIDQFAAQIAAMDLVITIDNSTAHLAGALGVPVWVLLPFDPDWRWLASGETSPWYPRMRLFRQPKPGDWPSVIEDVRHTLSHQLLRTEG